MKLSSASFNRMLNQLGQSFSWRRGYACPCINRSSGQAKPNCPHCLGKGRLWSDAVVGSAGIVSREKMRQFASFGIWDVDDIMLSIPSDSPLYAMGQYDRVAALNRSEPFSLNLIMGLNDSIRFPILSVDRVFTIEDDELRDYEIPTVLEDGSLEWPGDVPSSGATVSFTGRRSPEYFCYMEIPVDRPLHFGEKLPRRVTLRRFDLFGR